MRWGPYLSQIFLVGLGGFIGSSLRYVLGGLVHRVIPFAAFPYGTLTVNVLGCLAIGVFGGLSDFRQAFTPEARLLLFIGVLGGFTTFSTFAYETLALLHNNELLKMMANAFGHLVLCLGAVWLGYALARVA